MASDASRTGRSQYRANSVALAFLSAAMLLLEGCESRVHELELDPATMKQVAKVSDRFLSYNVEMVEVTGGRFWRPYQDGKREGDDRYEYRPPMDLTDPRLIKLAAELGPAFIRISGTWANATYFDPESAHPGKPPQGFDNVLTGDQWRHVIEFADAADARIVTSFATSSGTRDEAGIWQSSPQAERLMAFTASLGANIAAAEFANEPETVELTQAPIGYTPADYQRDYGRFHDWLRAASPSTIILAPGAAELGQPTQFLRKWMSGYTVFKRDELISPDQHRPDAVSFHYYGEGSQRCGEIPLFGHDKEGALSESWLGGVDHAIALTMQLRDNVARGAPLWITETGEAACGGNPWASMFTDVFRFIDQAARAARQGVEVYIHNTLAASDYGLLDETTHLPRPNYWAAWLWKRFMGVTVLDAREGREGLHLYAHCMKNQPGGVVVLAINFEERKKQIIKLSAPGKLFSLREGSTPAQAHLNGSLLQLGFDESLPTPEGTLVAAGPLEVSTASVNFITFASAANSSCM